MSDNPPTLVWINEQINGSNKHMGDADAAALAESLRGNTTLTVLFLTDNQIGDAGATALAECLRGNTTLTLVCLRSNQIGDAGATALAEGLRGNTTLTKLFVVGNHIGDAGATALAGGLRGNTALTALDLCENQIGDAGATALAESLRGNTTLTDLWMGANQIGVAGVYALAEIRLALYRNQVLARFLCVLPESITLESDYTTFFAQCLQVSFNDMRRIFMFLDRCDFAQICLVCKLWRRLANETIVERPLDFFM
jgi:hypothetical protein